MQRSPAVWAALAMTTLALAGCTGGGELDMLVTPSSDPVTEAFLFEATGPEFDQYEWDFGDGISAEGAEVEHLFGFTNGDVVVRLTASNEGEDPVSINRKVSLGGTRNTNPQGMMVSSSYWVDPGERFIIDASSSTDEDGDPLLYRWNCKRVVDLTPPDTSHAPHAGLGGVPFGVDAWSGLDPNITTSGTDMGDDLCNTLDSGRPQDRSREDSAIEGSIPQDGEYVIEVFVSDPKGAPWVGRLNLYVASLDRPKPEPTRHYETGATFQGGAGGGFDGLYYNGVKPPGDDGGDGTPPPSEVTGEDNQTYDYTEFTFFVDIHAASGEIMFTHDGQPDQADQVRYSIFDESGKEVVQSQNGDYSFGQNVLKSNRDGTPQEHIIAFTLQQGADVEFAWAMDIEHDLNPLHWYEPPPL